MEDSDEDGDCKIIIYSLNVLVLAIETKLKYDSDGVLSYETIVNIFDKRQAIKGIKKMKYDFVNKRRKLL